ncbi:Late blight resistance protein R1-A [Capsicum annuum]|uniref:Late blight resistance protein R1-A n=1 Tax=Capsicum annuum TaxID=4072 RepID=A0A2G3A7V6_CAPAN|nr:putative late blight resistance protein homolog R1C-3 [Capsicum annuum]KAF3665558.1 Late blight resistance protein R1-A [Capsicum annuum]KAF3675794.1 Late blight resistance protein R1-A [Capsicum annuum]PHT90288.1 Late blight resistance protein R1-A [Capsicum annuum]
MSSHKVSKERIAFLERELKFLDTFLVLQSQRVACDDMPEYATQKAQALLRNSRVALSSLDLTSPNTSQVVQQMEDDIQMTKLEIRANYSFHKTSLQLSASRDEIADPRFVEDFMDIVAAHIHDLVKIDDAPSLQEVLKELKMLRSFIRFVSERCNEPQNQHTFFTHALVVAGHVAMLVWLYFTGRDYKNKDLALGEINVLVFLQMKIKPIRPRIREIYVAVLKALKSTIQSGWHPDIKNEHVADSEASFIDTILHNLLGLSTNSSPSRIVALKDQMEILQEMLKLLRANIIHIPIQDLEFHLSDINNFIVDAGLLVYSLYDSEEEDMASGEVNQALLDLPGNIHQIKAIIYFIIRKPFQSNLPMIHGLGYVDILLNKLAEFQAHYADSLVRIQMHLQIIQNQLMSLQPFLEAVAEKRHSMFERQHYATLLIGKAYEVEYILDAACISKEIPYWCLECWLIDIGKEISLIIAEIPMIQDTMNTNIGNTSSQLDRTPNLNDEIVGFEDEIAKLRARLTEGTKARDVISIVGMPGQGKTTLAYRLYSDKSVVAHFDIRAQCSVSQLYSRLDLVLAILHDADQRRDKSILHDAAGEDSQRRKMREDDLADDLRKNLLPKRYLILLDDVWETSVWDDLRGCFQDANNGSRIIITTRDHEVANYSRCHSEPLQLRMFNDGESWMLLKKKVFGEEHCPPLLTNVGKKIAKKCGKLPLSIALVAGILSEMEKKEEYWERVAANLGSHIHSDSKAIIEQSYQNLPYHLRCCFLYFGSFLEDTMISVSKLTKLWTSEGFIKGYEGKSPEDIAECYLENLITRNLVMDAKRSFGGKIKACRVHDLLHDFCKERAKEENLLLWIEWGRINPMCYSHKQLAQRRMSIYARVNTLERWSSSCSLVSSVIFHNYSSIAQASHIFHRFKFLKVLDLELAEIDSLPTNLVHLRYFAAGIDQKSIPSSISNLWNLEYLILKSSQRTLFLPNTLWKLVKLRHLDVSASIRTYVTKNKAQELPETSSKLYDLETLSYPYFSCVEDVELMLRKTPHLRKLKCMFMGTRSYQYPVVEFPSRLETLKIIRPHLEWNLFYPELHLSLCISSPNTKNLTVSNFYLVHWNLSNIGLLQNLQVLKLKAVYFQERQWEVSNDEFLQLKVLKLVDCVWFHEWTIEDDAFPSLEHLVLRGCKRLKAIPSCFGDISSLMSIEVRKCNEFVVNSAREIFNTQVEDYQNSSFKVIIL